VHVWIRDEAGRYLIQQRAAHLAHAPGIWAVTAGYIRAGEESLAAAIRETSEELSLTLRSSQLRFFGGVNRDDVRADLWLADVSSGSLPPVVPGPDVSDWRWADRTEVESMVRSGVFFPYSYLEEFPK
jgi:8-oxo-dGTP pyrophosphatase MutT (NUDIX family)